MALAVRNITASKWRGYSWVPAGEIQADVLADLKVGEGRLSLWIVDDARSNLAEVAVALAAGRQHLDRLDVVLFDRAIIDRLGLKTEATPGKTPFRVAQNLHIDVLEVTAKKLGDLAVAISTAGAKQSFRPREVAKLILGELNASRIARTELATGLASDLDRHAA